MLEKYTKDAERILKYWIRNKQYKIRDYQEIIAGLVYVLYDSDKNHKPEMAPLSTYRFINCDRFLKTYFGKMARRSKLVKNELPQIQNRPENIIVESPLNWLRDNSNLTTLEREHVNYFLEGLSAKETAKLFNTTRSNVYRVLKTCVEKMRLTAGV